MSRFYFPIHIRQAAVFLVLIALVVGITSTDAAYRITRPIAVGEGHINQYYLYGEGGAVHKGIDYPANLDTSVYAVASSVVQQVEEDYLDGCSPSQQPPNNCPAFGNFVLVRHDKQHCDRTTGQMA